MFFQTAGIFIILACTLGTAWQVCEKLVRPVCIGKTVTGLDLNQACPPSYVCVSGQSTTAPQITYFDPPGVIANATCIPRSCGSNADCGTEGTCGAFYGYTKPYGGFSPQRYCSMTCDAFLFVNSFGVFDMNGNRVWTSTLGPCPSELNPLSFQVRLNNVPYTYVFCVPGDWTEATLRQKFCSCLEDNKIPANKTGVVYTYNDYWNNVGSTGGGSNNQGNTWGSGNTNTGNTNTGNTNTGNTNPGNTWWIGNKPGNTNSGNTNTGNTNPGNTWWGGNTKKKKVPTATLR